MTSSEAAPVFQGKSVSLEATDLDVVLEALFEACKKDLALPWLETVHHGGYGALQVSPRKEDKLLHWQRAGLFNG